MPKTLKIQKLQQNPKERKNIEKTLKKQKLKQPPPPPKPFFFFITPFPLHFKDVFKNLR
jgi:hypothetical protein